MAQESKNSSTGIIVAIITVIGAIIAATITVSGNYNVEKMRQDVELTKIALSMQSTQMVLQITAIVPTEAIAPTITTIAPAVVPQATATSQVAISDTSAKLYVLGYAPTDLAVVQASSNCTNCEIIFLSSPSELPDEWNHHSFNLASPTANLPDGCRTKQELINLGVTLMVANNYTPCKATYNKSTFALLVGVTNQTAFNLSAASDYSYAMNVESVDNAILELSKVYSNEDIIYVVHVPDLRATPGNPGSCKLFLNDVEKLKQYPLGWIIGGKNIIPSQFESSLQFCFSQ